MTETLGGSPGGYGGPAGAFDDAGQGTLSRRIEELAAQAATELEAELSVGADVSALRSEVSGLDARLAALEDALSGVAERLEAFAREGASQTGDRLAAIARDVGALSARLDTGHEALRAFVADRGADTAATLIDAQRTGSSGVMNKVDEAVLGLAGSVREAIDELAGSVEGSLGALGGSVGTALAEARDSHADRLDDIAGSVAGLRESIVGEVERVRDEATELLDEVRSQVTEQLELTRTAIGEVSGELRDHVTNQLDETTGAITARMGEVKRGVDVASSVLDELRRRVDASTKVGADTAASVGQLAQDWTTLTGRVVEETRAAAAVQLDDFRERVSRDITIVRESLQETAGRVATAQGALDDGTRRLEIAGTGLLRYLAERDLALEAERDRMLGEILEEFGRGLSKGDRRALAGRVSESLERHRDARDADRWRAMQAGQPPPGPVPLVVAADSDDLLAPSDPTSFVPGLVDDEERYGQEEDAPGAAEPAAPVAAPAASGRRLTGSGASPRTTRSASTATRAGKAPAKATKATKTAAKTAAAAKPAGRAPAAKPAKPAKPAKATSSGTVSPPDAKPAKAAKATASGTVGPPAAKPAKRSTREAREQPPPTAGEDTAVLDDLLGSAEVTDRGRGGAETGGANDDGTPRPAAVDAFTAALQPRRGRFARRTRS